MSRPRAKRPVRNPFVVTLAAATSLLAGCGARVDGAPTDAGTGTDSQPSDCPTSQPVRGTACSGEITCGYGDCYGVFTQTATCTKGAWSVIEMSCNPPPPDYCPPNAPSAGSPCYSEGKWCEYLDRCSPSAMLSFSCRSGAWQGSPVATPAACPTAPPVDGTSCAECSGRYPETCVYEYCGGYPSREAICNPITKTWSTRWSSCNPPPPDVDAGPPAYDADSPDF